MTIKDETCIPTWRTYDSMLVVKNDKEVTYYYHCAN
jgi:hypothetical protein